MVYFRHIPYSNHLVVEDPFHSTSSKLYVFILYAWADSVCLQGLPSFIQVVLIWWAPESPRWLMSKGRRVQPLVLRFPYKSLRPQQRCWSSEDFGLLSWSRWWVSELSLIWLNLFWIRKTLQERSFSRVRIRGNQGCNSVWSGSRCQHRMECVVQDAREPQEVAQSFIPSCSDYWCMPGWELSLLWRSSRNGRATVLCKSHLSKILILSLTLILA